MSFSPYLASNALMNRAMHGSFPNLAREMAASRRADAAFVRKHGTTPGGMILREKLAILDANAAAGPVKIGDEVIVTDRGVSRGVIDAVIPAADGNAAEFRVISPFGPFAWCERKHMAIVAPVAVAA